MLDSWNSCYDPDTEVPDDPGFSTFFWHVYSKNKFTDVVFELQTPDEPISFSAHRVVMSMWSPKFADLFYGQEKKRKNIVPLKNINPEAFESMLRFMYGIAPKLQTHKKACDLYKVAAEFGVSNLCNLCCQYLDDVEVEIGNVFDILSISDYMQNWILKDRCLKLIQEETKKVLDHFQLTDIKPSMVDVILDCPKLSLDSELELLLWIFAWAKNVYLENSEYNNTREVLTEFLPRLHFCALTNTQFAMLYRHHDVFFSKDEALGIFMNIAIRGSWAMPDWYDSKAKFREYSGNGDQRPPVDESEVDEQTKIKTVDQS